MDVCSGEEVTSIVCVTNSGGVQFIPIGLEGLGGIADTNLNSQNSLLAGLQEFTMQGLIESNSNRWLATEVGRRCLAGVEMADPISCQRYLTRPALHAVTAM